MKKIIFFLFPLYVSAQTKGYLNLNASPGQAPTVNAAWNVTSGNVFKMWEPTKDGSTITSTTSGNTGAAAVRNLLIKSFISYPLAAQTFSSQSLSAQIRENMSSTSSRTGEMRIYFRLLHADGTVSEIGNTNSTTALSTTLTNKTATSLTFTQTTVAGDRFLFEVGWRYLTGTNTVTNGVGSFGSSSATDLTASGTETTANNPWIQISQTVVFQNGYRFFF